MPKEIPDVERCPYCGTVLEQEARYDSDLAAEVLRFLADVWDAEPTAVGLLLLRVRYHTESLTAICGRLGITKSSGTRLWKSLARYSPELAKFGRGYGTKVHGMDGGRKKQGGKRGL